MKKLLQKIFGKIVSKSVEDVVSNTEVQNVVTGMDDGKKNIWKFVIQTLISILTAILATSCMGIH